MWNLGLTGLVSESKSLYLRMCTNWSRIPLVLIYTEKSNETSSLLFFFVGAHPPDLTPDQLEMPSSRISANLGRCLGVAFGCLLGMFPLLFINTSGNEEAEKEQEKP